MSVLCYVIHSNFGRVTAVHVDNNGILQFAVNHQAKFSFQKVNYSHHFFPLSQRQQEVTGKQESRARVAQ